MEKRFKKIFSSPNKVFEMKLSKSCYTFIHKSIMIKSRGTPIWSISKYVWLKNSGEGTLQGTSEGLLSPNNSLQLCLHRKIREGMKHKHITQRCSGISVNSLCPTTQLFPLSISPSENLLCINHYSRYNEVVQRISPWTMILH